MPTDLLEIAASVSPSDPPRKVWTRAECEILETSGLLEGQHYELIDGELINKMGKKQPHVNALAELADCLAMIFGRKYVNREAPIDVAPQDNPTNEPEPDAIVLRRKRSNFVSGRPRPEDVWLVVEVAQSTLKFDLKKKAALYARARIVEYWVLDVASRKLFVHRDPRDGAYRSVVAYTENESVAPLGAPNSLFLVGDAFQD